MYLYLSSRDSRDKFPSNDGGEFNVELGTTIHCGTSFSLALLQIVTSCPESSQDLEANQGRVIHVYCDACLPSIVGNAVKPVIACLSYEELAHTAWVRFDRPLYIPIRLDTISSLKIYLRDDGGKPLEFLENTVTSCLMEITRIT